MVKKVKRNCGIVDDDMKFFQGKRKKRRKELGLLLGALSLRKWKNDNIANTDLLFALFFFLKCHVEWTEPTRHHLRSSSSYINFSPSHIFLFTTSFSFLFFCGLAFLFLPCTLNIRKYIYIHTHNFVYKFNFHFFFKFQNIGILPYLNYEF